jgi:polysaccharide biosynthesis/export protein
VDLRLRPLAALLGTALLCALLAGGLAPSAVAQSPQEAPASKPARSRYTLAPLDVVTVTVHNQPRLSGDFLVPEGGFVSFPLAGDLQVEGLTLVELAGQLAKALSSELLAPKVSVVLKSPRPRKVSVTGEVNRPGAYDLAEGWRLSDLLGAAGGLPPGVREEDVQVTVVSRSGERRQAMLPQASEDAASNLAVAEGDVVHLDSGGISVYVVGQVKSPGLQRLQRGNGVLEAIAGAGGTLSHASLSKVRLVRLSGAEESLNLVPALTRGEPSALPKLRQGDLLVVPEHLEQFAVLGYVSAPGAYPFPEGREIRLADAVAAAKGHDGSKRPRMSQVGIARVVDGKAEHQVYNLGKFFTGGDLAQNPLVRAGDVIYVPETNQVPLRDLMSSVGNIALLWRAAR